MPNNTQTAEATGAHEVGNSRLIDTLEVGAARELLPEHELRAEFAKLMDKLDAKKWDAGERATYFAFFCHGWYGRENSAAYQFNL